MGRRPLLGSLQECGEMEGFLEKTAVMFELLNGWALAGSLL